MRGTRYGYGWNVLELDGRRTIRHAGETLGFNASLAIWPDDGSRSGDLSERVRDARRARGVRAQRRVRGGRGAAAPRASIPEPPELVADAASVAGRFVSGDRTIELEAAEGGLVLRSGPLRVRLERWPDAGRHLRRPASGLRAASAAPRARPGGGGARREPRSPVVRPGRRPPRRGAVRARLGAVAGLYRSDAPVGQGDQGLRTAGAAARDCGPRTARNPS